MKDLNENDLLIYYNNLYDEISKELNLISSVIELLNKGLNKNNDQFNTLENSSLLKENQFVELISLGLLYLSGKEVTKNQQKALQLILKSVTKGLCLGKFYIGECYNYGYGIIKDSINSFNWYLKSAEEGNAKAKNAVGYCYNIGESYLYESGLATSKDKNKAIEYYLNLQKRDVL
ncbi:13576_t:CDS:2 [Gigaspora margarita]|uniref:13576_t:CDS:1 n=1 Tax=Gigaspora margarita TaxID=4874 RepID=A0ABN7VYP6_GIGMA|nr:13576_t:CDS:2 [Gigaspora margarita]